jgi:N-acetylglucosamine-6-phosphate deacetylase
MTLLAGLVASGGEVRPGWLEIADERVVATGSGAPPGTADLEYDGIVARGFCDLQVNGAAGVEVTAGPAALDRIDETMLAHGVTSYLPTVVSTDSETAARVVEEIGERMHDPASPVEGAHLEGPFLSHEFCGRHRPQFLRVPAEPLPAYYGDAAVRMVTLAPELPGAGNLIAGLVGRGVVVSIGHSGASFEDARRATDAGATVVTHLFNGMAPLHHRNPGLVGCALFDERLRFGLISDGFHIDPAVLTLVSRIASSRVVLVSDASPAAGARSGRYELTGFTMEGTPEGRAQTLDGLLAGSAILLDDAVRRWRDYGGVDLATALEAASERPAGLIGLPSRLEEGAFADLVLLTADGYVRRTMRRGRWID